MSTPPIKPATTYPAIVGQVLVALRAIAGLSQAQLATALGVTQATWSRIERAGSSLTIDQLAVVAKALDVQPSLVLHAADVVAALVERRGISVDHRRWEVLPTVASQTKVAIPPEALAPFVEEALVRLTAAGASWAEREKGATDLLAEAAEGYYAPGADRSIRGAVARAQASARLASETVDAGAVKSPVEAGAIASVKRKPGRGPVG